MDFADIEKRIAQRTSRTVTMEAPGSYVAVNNHGTFRRRFPKVKGKKAVKQAKKMRRLLRESSKQVVKPALMSPSKDETREG